MSSSQTPRGLSQCCTRPQHPARMVIDGGTTRVRSRQPQDVHSGNSHVAGTNGHSLVIEDGTQIGGFTPSHGERHYGCIVAAVPDDLDAGDLCSSGCRFHETVLHAPLSHRPEAFHVVHRPAASPTAAPEMFGTGSTSRQVV